MDYLPVGEALRIIRTPGWGAAIEAKYAARVRAAEEPCWLITSPSCRVVIARPAPATPSQRPYHAPRCVGIDAPCRCLSPYPLRDIYTPPWGPRQRRPHVARAGSGPHALIVTLGTGCATKRILLLKIPAAANRRIASDSPTRAVGSQAALPGGGGARRMARSPRASPDRRRGLEPLTGGGRRPPSRSRRPDERDGLRRARAVYAIQAFTSRGPRYLKLYTGLRAHGRDDTPVKTLTIPVLRRGRASVSDWHGWGSRPGSIRATTAWRTPYGAWRRRYCGQPD